MWAVDFRTENAFVPGKPYLLFRNPGFGHAPLPRMHDVAPGNQRFLMIKLQETKLEPVTEMILV